MEIIDKKPFEQVTKDFDEIVKRYDFLSDIERSKTEFYYNESSHFRRQYYLSHFHQIA